MRDAQPHGRDVAGERLDARPVEEAARRRRCRASARGSSRRDEARAGPTSTPTTRYQPSRRASSISFERTSRAPSTLISCRSSTSLLQQHLLSAALERLQVEPARAQRHAAVLDLGDRVGRDEHLAARRRSRARPVTGGYSSSPSRTIRSSTRPSLPPPASRRSPRTTSERWSTGGGGGAASGHELEPNDVPPSAR